jgi:hypothetical protein
LPAEPPLFVVTVPLTSDLSFPEPGTSTAFTPPGLLLLLPVAFLLPAPLVLPGNKIHHPRANQSGEVARLPFMRTFST